MELKNVGLRFRGKYKIIGGQHFRGQVLDIPDTSRVSNFLTARRYLRTHIGVKIEPAMAVLIDNQKYIVAHHGTGFYKNPIYRHFKLFEVDQEVEWFTNTEIKNSVTGVLEKSNNIPQGSILVSVQPKSQTEDTLLIQSPNHTIVTNSPISVDDKLGDNWVVTRVDHLLGIYVAEVKEG